MSEIEEPPAKVLKIDTIDGATKTNTTDASLLETSTAQEEVHEEWLSEGILTDDDYNTASQEDDDRTNSQLGSQGDLEENLDTSLESSNNDTKQIHTDIQTVLDNLHKNIQDDEVENADNGTLTAENGTENAENDTEIAENGTEIAANGTEISENLQENAEVETVENVLQIAENETEMSIDQSNASDSHVELDNTQNEQEIAQIEPEIEQNDEITQNTQEIAQITQETALTESNLDQEESEIAQNEQEIARNALEKALNEQTTDQNELENANKPEILENLLITLGNDENNVSEINTMVIMDSQVKISGSNIIISNANEAEMQPQVVEQNIEETMKHLDGSKDDMNSDEFNDLLLKKSDDKANDVKTKEVKKDDDGNDTDDLLRMLGEDDNKSKKLTKTVKDLRRGKMGDDSSDDDDFVYEGPGVKKLKAAKSVISKKQPTKAIPEEFDDDDEFSSDHSDDALKLIFKSNVVKGSQNVRTNQRSAKHILNVVDKPSFMRDKSTPVKHYQNKHMKFNKSILKPTISTPKPAPAQNPSQTNKTVRMEVKKENKIKFKPPTITTPSPFNSYKVKANDGEYVDEQFLDDEQDEDDDDQLMESELDEISKSRQRIMRPEMMEEDIPSDGESYTEGSFYDEIPSSDSEDMDDWFTLDIRAEKAGDYIPLLGARAKQLLLEEKERVASRLVTLKKSLTALTDSGKQQADQLRDATMTLAELDDMIKAS